jgi:hypothetical protein
MVAHLQDEAEIMRTPDAEAYMHSTLHHHIAHTFCVSHASKASCFGLQDPLHFPAAAAMVGTPPAAHLPPRTRHPAR